MKFSASFLCELLASLKNFVSYHKWLTPGLPRVTLPLKIKSERPYKPAVMIKRNGLGESTGSD